MLRWKWRAGWTGVPAVIHGYIAPACPIAYLHIFFTSTTPRLHGLTGARPSLVMARRDSCLLCAVIWLARSLLEVYDVKRVASSDTDRGGIDASTWTYDGSAQRLRSLVEELMVRPVPPA